MTAWKDLMRIATSKRGSRIVVPGFLQRKFLPGAQNCCRFLQLGCKPLNVNPPQARGFDSIYGVSVTELPTSVHRQHPMSRNQQISHMGAAGRGHFRPPPTLGLGWMLLEHTPWRRRPNSSQICLSRAQP
eukprot:EG_transcript_30394